MQINELWQSTVRSLIDTWIENTDEDMDILHIAVIFDQLCQIMTYCLPDSMLSDNLLMSLL